MVIEGMLALTGQHFIMDFNEREGTLPGFVEGFTRVARDEHRHVAFGARFLRDMVRRDERHLAAIQRTLVEVGPVADARPAPAVDGGRRRRADAVRRVGGRDARVRDEGARAAHEGHRARRGVSTPEIDFDQFLAVDMRVGVVTAVDDFPEARKPAWKLTIDFGPGDRSQALLGADHQLRPRGARGAARRRGRQLPAAPDRPVHVRGAVPRRLERGGRDHPAAPRHRRAGSGRTR